MSDKQYEPTYEGQLDKCQDERHALQMQLEEYIEAFKFAHKEFHEALDDLAKMKAERDGARRELCAARRELCRNEAIIRLQRHRVHRDSEDVVGLAKEIAVERGWDCFKENKENN